MAAASKSLSPGTVVATIVVLLLAIGVLWWKTMGGGSVKSGEALNPNTPPGGGAAMPVGPPGVPGPGGVQSGPPGGQMPGR
jgi:hypothetical protein